MENKKEIERVAKNIAEQLFTDGGGKKVQRLVMESQDGTLGGGWIKASVIRVIMDHLKAAAMQVETRKE